MTVVKNYGQAKKLNKFRAAAALFFRDASGKILLVKSLDKDHWGLVGGAAERKETLKETAERETLEEIGLARRAGRLLKLGCLKRKMDGGVDEAILAIFDGGIITEEEKREIKLQEDEIEKIDFFKENEAAGQLKEKSFTQMITEAVLKDNNLEGNVYLEKKE
jgi:8-oxo-dGTP pyrophosphatase MutT (NUDIX family)